MIGTPVVHGVDGGVPEQLREPMVDEQAHVIYLSDEQRAALATRAAAEGTSAAELVRRLIDQALRGSSDDLTADLAAVDASFGALRDDELNVDIDRADGQLVTNAEIVGGMRSAERREVTLLLNSLRPLPVTDMIAHRAGDLRQRYRRSHCAIGLVDYLIAATALVHGLELETLNIKHFPMFTDLQPPFVL